MVIQMLESPGIGTSFEFAKVKRGGIAATKFRVLVTETKRHRHLPEILKIVEGCTLRRAQKLDRRFRVSRPSGGRGASGTDREGAFFHEVGAADSIANIVGASIALELLDIDKVACLPSECRIRTSRNGTWHAARSGSRDGVLAP